MNKTTTDSIHKNSVDNFILSALVALLASSLFILSASKPENSFLCYSLVLAVLFNIISFFLILWHKIRWQKRVDMFERKQNKVIKKHANRIRNALVSFIPPKMLVEQIKRNIPLDVNQARKNLDSLLSSVMEEPATNELMLNLSENLVNEMAKEHTLMFHKPLKESFARIRHAVDILSNKTRYYFFTIGMVFWFISFCLHLFA